MCVPVAHSLSWSTSLKSKSCTGNKGLAGIISNPVIANGVAGLATSATAQATIERFVLWTLRDTVCFPTFAFVVWLDI